MIHDISILKLRLKNGRKKIEWGSIEKSHSVIMIEIMKRAVFNCCRREWKRIVNPSEINIEQKCNRCRRWVSPRLEQWSKRWFGSFKCTSKSCGRIWTSSWTWTVNNQIQTTQCQTCKTSVLSYQLVSSKIKMLIFEL